MNLEQFIASLAYAVFLDPSFNDSLRVAGVFWEKLDDYFGQEMTSYLRLAADKGTKYAQHEFNELPHSLSIMGGKPGLAPNDPDVITLKFQELWRERSAVNLALEIKHKPQECLSLIQNFVLEFGNIQDFDLADISKALLPQLKQKAKNKELAVELPDYPKLSQMIGGFNPGRIGILLGQTGLGKTNAALNFAMSGAKKFGVCLANMEMNPEDIARRAIVIKSRMGYRDFYYGDYDLSQTAEAFNDIEGRLFVTSGKPLTVEQIKAWVRSKKKNNIKLLIIDYDLKLDLPFDRTQPEWKQIQKAIIDLESFSKDENLYTLVLSQINRSEEVASSHRALYTAHTVLKFFKDKEHGFLIHAEKNRHGLKDQALKATYVQDNSNIFEDEVITYEKRTGEQARLSVSRVQA